MKLVYAGGTMAPGPTFKRLLLLGDEIVFTDRPSVTFHVGGQWGHVGMPSPARQFVSAFVGTPILVDVYAPPSGPAQYFYEAYVRADLDNPEFRRVVLEGLAKSGAFARKVMQLDADYRSGRQMLKGRQIVAALLADAALANSAIKLEDRQPGSMFEIETPAQRRDTLLMLLVDASIHVTNAMIVAHKAGHTPVTDDPYLARLLALRTVSPAYVGTTPTRNAQLGLEIAKAVVPDEALSHLTFGDIIDYRKRAADAYRAWSIELDRLATALDDVPPERLDAKVANVIASQVMPKLQEYRDAMKEARDKLFGDLIKKVVTFEVPTLSVAYIASLSLGGVMAAFAGALAPAVPAIVDYVQSMRKAGRIHAASYLVGVTPDAP